MTLSNPHRDKGSQQGIHAWYDRTLLDSISWLLGENISFIRTSCFYKDDRNPDFHLKYLHPTCCQVIIILISTFQNDNKNIKQTNKQKTNTTWDKPSIFVGKDPVFMLINLQPLKRF